MGLRKSSAESRLSVPGRGGVEGTMPLEAIAFYYFNSASKRGSKFAKVIGIVPNNFVKEV